MSQKVDLKNIILQQSTLISLYVFCYYSVFYVIKLVSEECLIDFGSSACTLNYIFFYALFIFFLFVVFLFYTFKNFKERFSEDIENEVYVIIFLTYFTCFEIAGLILGMHLTNRYSILTWLNISIVLFCSYFYSSLKVIYVDLKKANNKDTTAIVFSIILLFSLNVFGFVQAKEQAYSSNKKCEQKVQNF